MHIYRQTDREEDIQAVRPIDIERGIHTYRQAYIQNYERLNYLQNNILHLQQVTVAQFTI